MSDTRYFHLLFTEPTSGLDSFSAMQVIKVLKKIAQAGCSVLFTIHQPSSDVFNSFDRLILLNRGMVMYQGSVNDCPNFFAQHNHTMPKNYNPADWIMSVAQQYTQEQLITEGFFAENDRVLPPALVPKDGELLNSLGVSRRGDVEDDEWKHVGFGTETRVLFQREIRHNLRNKQGVGARFALTTFISILVGSIFFGVGGVESYTDPSVSVLLFAPLCQRSHFLCIRFFGLDRSSIVTLEPWCVFFVENMFVDIRRLLLSPSHRNHSLTFTPAPGDGIDDLNVRNSLAYSHFVPRRKTSLLERVLNQPLRCCVLLHFTSRNGSTDHLPSDTGDPTHCLLHGRSPGWFLQVPRY